MLLGCGSAVRSVAYQRALCVIRNDNIRMRMAHRKFHSKHSTDITNTYVIVCTWQFGSYLIPKHSTPKYGLSDTLSSELVISL